MLGESSRLLFPILSSTVQKGVLGKKVLATHGKYVGLEALPQWGQFTVRYLSMQRLTNSLELISSTPRKLIAPVNTKDGQVKFAVEKVTPNNPNSTNNGSPEVIKGSLTTSSSTTLTPNNNNNNNGQQNLCVIIGWLMSRRKHVLKYAKFYLDQGFDVLHVSCSPWQLLWPTTGGRVIARDILTFIGNNQHYGPTVLHGFSVGAYVWGQLLCEMNEHPERHQYMHQMMVGQIWDSVVDVEGCVQGVGNAVLPNNPIPRYLLESYVKFHVNTFQELVMQHYLQTSVLFHNSEIRTPTLFFSSEDDPVALYHIVERIADRWERNGCPVYWKAWKSSPHVSHIWRYPEEYKAEMKAFLNKIGVLKYPEKFQVKSAARN